MTINDAVACRILNLLSKSNMSQYRLEIRSGMPHGSLDRILSSKNKTVTLTTIYRVSRGFGITVNQFLDDPIFDAEKVEFD